ncbi:hypothetical protein AGRHK599_LOCUS2082 [Rhizobium rhizogenes]|uniref:Uncharacterized protein n=1 Tax=Rhizobium rhizogenes TaxID=359 RepID=A0AAN2A564_RHIRH|nr:MULTISPECIES: hypothetical protein [Rhizobium/Agrobacterium group]AQS61030.1 hypothetical protein B0909_01175 [Rhizobium rhizogenes]MCZ7445391.1 hypothetical protein [Rhizobium rhizogenes]NSZ79819.1 hypothetical protein [Agrobacterium tumefaciens]OAM63940.1 hypothetical protein A8L48_12300 [Rhizobium rhizogenes]CAD0212815.1 hypothetical protein AGRHK599_LOCUS2082 [Rhizobium rhizogenes]
MFDTFPVDALAHNWLSEILLEEIEREISHAHPEALPAFPHFVQQPYRSIFERYESIVSRFHKLATEIRQLNTTDKALVHASLRTQNSLPAILLHDFEYQECATALPKIHALAVDLFSTAFERLSVIKSPDHDDAIRDWHFDLIFNAFKKKTCAACGLEKLERPDADIPRPDLDHYLSISQYPFAGVNLMNLTPMGIACNTRYKLAKDVLNDDAGSRTDSFDPYGELRGTISLEGSRFLPADHAVAEWRVSIVPDTAMGVNWDRLFKIKSRYSGVLYSDFADWVEQFSDYVARHGMSITDREAVLSGLGRFIETCRYEALPAVALLKASAMRLFHDAIASEELGSRMHQFLMQVNERRTTKEHPA